MTMIYGECEHGLQADPVTGGHITEGGKGWFKVETCPRAEKCEHGNLVLFGDPDGFARYCTGCNAEARRIIAPMPRNPEVRSYERTTDVAEYLTGPIADRMLDAERMLAL